MRPLHVLREQPFNAETPLEDQLGLITPNSRFYVRSHGSAPRISAEQWSLSICGEVSRAFELGYDDLRALPSHSLLVTLECAGNGRSFFHPAPGGEPWRLGAVSTAEWTGVPLGVVLEMAGLSPRAREVVFVGADRCEVPELGQPIPFARSLPIATAFDPDVLLAYAMNGEPLPREHGFPVRLVVPGWYGVASVKWLEEIEVIDHPFEGYYQKDRYVLESEGLPSAPVTNVRPRSLILTPLDGSVVARGPVRIAGVAWSGMGNLSRVDVSVDGGDDWQEVALVSPAEPYAWRRWEHLWEAITPGTFTLESRALDDMGHVQPESAIWNRYGYANNAIERVTVTVR
jgi:DMSO/TMAO reductase YedYZ molybdopterin-dependent catalytic subunit